MVAMQPFWEVLSADCRAFVAFACPMLLLSAPVSALAALCGAVNYGLDSWRRLMQATLRGTLMGTAAALGLSMLIEYALTLEGLSNSRRALSAATRDFILAAPLAAIAAGFLAARRYAPLSEGRRRWTLRQLFIGQLIAAVLLGWWTFTRREEISRRRAELAWQVRDRQLKAIFEPAGFEVQTWPNYEDISLRTAPGRSFTDTSMKIVGSQMSVTEIVIASDALSDAGLEDIRATTRLRRLWLHSSQLSDAGVARLAELPRLRYLEIHSPLLTGASLRSLAKIKTLRYVVLGTNNITSEELTRFQSARPDVNVRISAPAR
jgi:hypothetical protein